VGREGQVQLAPRAARAADTGKQYDDSDIQSFPGAITESE